PRLLHRGGEIPRLPVVALDLEDQVAGEVGRTRVFDHTLEERSGGIDPLVVVVEPAPPRFPELPRGEGVAGGMRAHPAFAREVAREGLEADVAAALDRRELGRAAGLLDAPYPIGAKRLAEDRQAQVVRARERGDALDLDRHLAHRRALAG